MAPPKAQKAGGFEQPSQQHPHTHYQSILNFEDIEIALNRSVCEAEMSYRCASEEERCNNIILNHVAFYTTVVE